MKELEPVMLTGSLVLYHNQADIFEAAIHCFLSGSPAGILFVIDNSEKALQSSLFEHPRVRYHFAGHNLGFGAGHNLALSFIEQLAGAPAQGHLFLNPDVAFGPAVLPTLLTEMAVDPSIGAVMPQVLFPDGQLQRLCKLLPTPVDLLLRRFLPWRPLVDALNRRYELFDLPQVGNQDVPSLSGCFLLVRSSVLKRVGGFDDRYFMYMEDVDLVRRIGDHARTVYVPSVTITHGYGKGSYLNPKLLGYHLRSACIYFWKWGWCFDQTRRERNRRTLNRLRSSPTASHPHTAAAFAATTTGHLANTHLRVAVAVGSGTTLTHHGQPLLVALRDAGCRPVIVGPNDAAIEALIAQGFDFIEVGTTNSLDHPWHALAGVTGLRRVLKTGCFDAVVTFAASSNILFGLAARSLSLPHVPAYFAQPTFGHAGRGKWSPWLARLHRWTLRSARWVLCQDADSRVKFVPRAPHVPHMPHMPHMPHGPPGADTSPCVPQDRLDLDQFTPAAGPSAITLTTGQGPRYLFTGELVHGDVVTALLSAMRQLKTKRPEAVMLWLGPIKPPSSGNVTQDELDGWVAEGLVEYLGAPQDMRPAIAAADALVLMCGDERMARIQIQAAAMARPCVAWNFNGHHDMVEHGVSGLLCDARDADSLARALLQFAALPRADQQLMGQQARRKAGLEFDHRASTASYGPLAAKLAVELAANVSKRHAF
jgi:GT2 family glycosyltransferase